MTKLTLTPEQEKQQKEMRAFEKKLLLACVPVALVVVPLIAGLSYMDGVRQHKERVKEEAATKKIDDQLVAQLRANASTVTTVRIAVGKGRICFTRPDNKIECDNSITFAPK